ncbi:carbohydrate-binding module 1 [Termitomyces sp. Mi166|nr:carbohydrate-binding module 1 [Termitomyces sp. Mi166\
MILQYSIVALALAFPALAQQLVYAQCGGIGWTGGTTCAAGTVCTHVNDWYYQCLPGTATTPTTPTTTPATTPTTTPTAVPTTTPTASPTSSRAGTATCSALPSSIAPTSNAKLPDPFKFVGGTRTSTKADWDCRREEISQLLQRYELGTLPPKPQSVTASLSGNTLTINVSDSGKSISFSVTISVPSGATAPYPAIIAYGGMSIPAPSGVAIITFNNDDMAAQVNSGSRGQGKFYTLYGSGHSAGAMTAWAWGVSRIIDALEITPNANINLQRIAVTGCSRNGKGALVAGAFETRIALTIPQESGSGGAGCWRISDDMLASGIDTQTASEIVQENVWFSPLFNQYVNQVGNLPFDHHMLSALVAPRALLIIDNTGIDWLGPRSVWGCQTTAHEIWKALGVPDSMGVSQVGNHNHCAFPSSEEGDLDAFVNKFLKGQNTNTNIIKTDGANNLGFVAANYVDWTTPTLT